jgi:hypothetical protein
MEGAALANHGPEGRLTALEEIAEEPRLRPIRSLAEGRGLPVDRVLEFYEVARARTARLRAEGKTDRAIFEATAAAMGMTPAPLQRRVDELTA